MIFEIGDIVIDNDYDFSKYLYVVYDTTLRTNDYLATNISMNDDQLYAHQVPENDDDFKECLWNTYFRISKNDQNIGLVTDIFRGCV